MDRRGPKRPLPADASPIKAPAKDDGQGNRRDNPVERQRPEASPPRRSARAPKKKPEPINHMKALQERLKELEQRDKEKRSNSMPRLAVDQSSTTANKKSDQPPAKKIRKVDAKPQRVTRKTSKTDQNLEREMPKKKDQ